MKARIVRIFSAQLSNVKRTVYQPILQRHKVKEI
jgi:hypothetical protein